MKNKTVKDILKETVAKTPDGLKKEAKIMTFKHTAFLDEHRKELEFLTQVAVEQFKTFITASDFDLYLCLQSIIIGVYIEAYEKGFIIGTQLKDKPKNDTPPN